MSRAKSSLHWSVLHCQVTFELRSGRGSETLILIRHMHTEQTGSYVYVKCDIIHPWSMFAKW